MRRDPQEGTGQNPVGWLSAKFNAGDIELKKLSDADAENTEVVFAGNKYVTPETGRRGKGKRI